MYKRTTVMAVVALSVWGLFQTSLTLSVPTRQSDALLMEQRPVFGQDTEPTVTSTLLTVTEALTETTVLDFSDAFTSSETLSSTLGIENQLDNELTASQAMTETMESSDAVDADDSTGSDPTESDPTESEPTESEPTDSAETVSDESDNASTDPDNQTPLGVVDGTILANRTTATVKFFVEGETLELPPLRSIGLDLPRTNAVLNLYNCDAEIAETDERCYWDPYMIDREKFYEFVSGVDVGRAVGLLLQEVGGPEGDAIWIQNRSGASEVVVYRNDVYDIQPGAIREFSVDDDALPTFFLRSCLSTTTESACEWAPAIVEAGDYYTLELLETVGALPESTISVLQLVSMSAEAADVNEEAVAETPIAVKQIQCDLLVPALNVRSGPGLEYQIVAKIRGTDEAPATVLIVGRSALGDWLAVDERVADGGWITASANFVNCDKPPSELDEVAITDGRLAPTPEPQPVAEAPAADAPAEGDAAVVDAEEAVPTPITEVPDGQSLMVINNGFEHDIRFTLDQRYRVEPGPSEIDLKAGDSVSIFVFPGMVGFSASTPWRTLSGNDDFYIEEQETRTLWLYFVPDPDGSGEWLLVY